MVGNIRKERRSWGRLARVLSREGADPKVSRTFYISVTQDVLLFGSKTLVVKSRMERALDSFQSRVARKLTGRKHQRVKDGTWYYPLLAVTIKEAGIVRIWTSILRR